MAPHPSPHPRPGSPDSTNWVIGFDADDTLWHCERDFAHVQRQFNELMTPWAELDRDASVHLDAVERRNLEVFGYGVKGFTLSMIETAIMLSDGGVGADEIGRIVGWGKDLLGQAGRGLDLLDGAADALDALAAHRLVLITKGDLFEQETKIAASGLAERFDVVEVVAEKSPATYAKVLGRHGIDPAWFVFAGNSVRSDVLPVLEIGGVAVHVPYPLVWAHEEAELPTDHPRVRVVDSLGALPELIATLPRPRESSSDGSRPGTAG